MFRNLTPHSVEVLESRIAPASVVDGVFKAGQVGVRIELQEGEGLSTGGDAGGAYLLFVEKGECLVFTTDLNNNGQLDYNEITGVSAGDGLRLICFTDIHGDIVTNLKPNGFLSDSDNNAANNPPALGGDGRVLLNSSIEKIELRSLTINDINDVNQDGVIDQADLKARFILSTYSIHGNIYAGKGFGTTDGGLLLNTTGLASQQIFYPGSVGADFFIEGVKATIGSIKIGAAVSDDYFSFGASRADDIQGFMVPFVPQPGVPGGSIQNIRAFSPTTQFNIDSLEAGPGGLGARGGNIMDVTLNGDGGGGYRIIAGNGGGGPTGGDGGSILNFVERSTINSSVVIKSGDGGNGLTGPGGAGGRIELGDFAATGNINILLGNGGSGFTAGGNGASLPKAVISSPSGPGAVPNKIVSAWHNRLTGPNALLGVASPVGTHAPVDFNGDGLSDYVFTSSNGGQLVVAFGDGSGLGGVFIDEDGIVRQDRIYLDGFELSEALVVGDFNNDGRPDVATGSTSTASSSGIRTFLSIFRDVDGDGFNETFDGFSRAIESPLPSLFTYAEGFQSGASRSANPITDMAAGDFDGDGFTDIAVTATYRDVVDTSEAQVLVILKGDVEANGVGPVTGTGSFYADFGPSDPPTIAEFFKPFVILKDDTNTSTLEATSLSSDLVASNHDVMIVALNGEKQLLMFDNYFLGAGGSFAGPAATVLPLAKVDTNRNVPDQNQDDATHRDFTILDFNNDGSADIAVVMESPRGFMVTFTGNAAAGTFAISSGAGDNAGIRLGNNGLGIGENHPEIRSTDADGDGLVDEVAFLNYSAGNNYYSVNEVALGVAAVTTATTVGEFSGSFNAAGRADNIVAWDTYPLTVGAGAITNYLVAVNSTNIRTATIESVGDALPLFLLFDFMNEYALNIVAGDGGDALVGRGGAGGFLGSGLTGSTTNPEDPNVVDPIGSLEITFPSNISQGTISTFSAGDGGNGFTQGGAGGKITGLSARDTGGSHDDLVRLRAGNGGFGVSGAGGAGGDLFSNSIERGIVFTAGNGGSGKLGGDGGSVIGNGVPSAYDSQTPALQLMAGTGGVGVKRGGTGGSITNFVSYFLPVIGGVPGPLIMIAGDGGSAVSGKGGTGGSITNSSPRDDINALADEIYMEAGDGGNGIKGGTGGSITKFINRPTSPDIPTIVSVIAGNGGAGTTGKGGPGGNITNVVTPSAADGANLFSGFTFNRILAGNGGGSSGNIGGAGGQITDTKVDASSGAIAVVAGAGGKGLQKGGAGGSVLNSAVSSGGPDTGGKVLVIGGAGGDASAFVANPNDPVPNGDWAFGGKIGRAGKGGSIINFTQENSIDVSVDLIAGNGGSTLNYGTFRDTKVFVGKGGSILNVNISGSIGNVAPDVPIKAYNDLDGNGTTDQPLAQWVADFMRNPLAASNLNDAAGNVGIIAGAAGRIKPIQTADGSFETQPAPGAVKLNGTVQNVTARLLMSAIAGDVNGIAAIRAARDIKISSGLVGADKDPAGFQYRDPEGNIIQSPVLGGGLLDGAFISDRIVPEINGEPRVFIR